MKDAILIPVYDWTIQITDWFDRENVTTLHKNDLTIKTSRRIVEKFRRKYPQSFVTATATTIKPNTVSESFIACPPLEMVEDENNGMTFIEWRKKWHGLMDNK